MSGELSAIICRTEINALVTAMLTWIAVSLRSTLDNMTTPCSVNAYGNAVFGLLTGDVITNCDDIKIHSLEVSCET